MTASLSKRSLTHNHHFKIIIDSRRSAALRLSDLITNLKEILECHNPHIMQQSEVIMYTADSSNHDESKETTLKAIQTYMYTYRAPARSKKLCTVYPLP